MKQKLLPLLLALAVLLAACGQSAPTTTPSPAYVRALDYGLYAMSDEDGVLQGHLQVTARQLTAYDAYGREQSVRVYRYDPETDLYTTEDGASFSVRNMHRGLVLALDGAEYILTTVYTLPTPTPVPVLSAEQIYELARASSVDVTAYISESYYQTGSGFFLDTEGTVLTNYHVVEDSFDAFVTDAEGNEYQVLGLLAWDAERDIAVLATDCLESVPLERREEAARTGETVYAYGSPLGFSATISDGIISNARRKFDGQTYLQHTAPISTGNSGGPLLDKNGRVLGIVCAYFEDGQNLNLAIPIADVENLEFGSVTPLERLFPRQQQSGPADGADWYTFCVASNLGWDLYAEVPEDMTGNFELNEDGTGLSAEYETDDYYLYLAADLLDTEGKTLSAEELDEFSTMLQDMMGEEAENSLVTRSTVTIRDAEWTVFTTTGTLDGGLLSNYLCLGYTPDGAGVALFNLLLAKVDAESDAGDAELHSILSSLFMDISGPESSGGAEDVETLAAQLMERLLDADMFGLLDLIPAPARQDFDLDDEDVYNEFVKSEQEIEETLQSIDELGYTMSYELRDSTQLTGRALQRLIRSYRNDYGVEVLDAVDVVIALVILDENDELLDDSSEQEFRFLQCEDGWYLDVDSMY